MKPAPLLTVEARRLDGVTVEVRRSSDPDRARRIARLLADLLATGEPDKR